MPAGFTIDENCLLVKTPRGREEITLRSHDLHPLQRRLLIVADGTKTVADLRAMRLTQDTDDIIRLLIGKELIAIERRVGTMPATAAAVTPAPAAPALTDDPHKVRQVKDFMMGVAKRCLGLLAADIVERIEKAPDARCLMSLVGQWHMALRESKKAHGYIDGWLEEVSSGLSGDTG